MEAAGDLILALHDPRHTQESLFQCLVEGTQRLVPHTTFIVACTDRQEAKLTTYLGPWRELAAKVAPGFERHVKDHPGFFRHLASSSNEVDAVSDHLGRRKWRSTGMYDEVFTMAGAEDEIVASLPMNERLTLSLVINRDRWGFSPGDHSILRLLVPQILQAWRTNALIRRLKQPESRVSWRLQLAVDQFGNVADCSDEQVFERLWQRFQGKGPHPAWRLPEEIRVWFRDRLRRCSRNRVGLPGQSLNDAFRDSSGGEWRLRLAPGFSDGIHILTVELAGSAEAKGVRRLRRLGLTDRQSQTLYWLAQGKTNEEIASILGIRLFTVKNHLKAIFDRLGVENRHAASMRAWRQLQKAGEGFF